MIINSMPLKELKPVFEAYGAWGMEMSLNLYQCDYDLITSETAIRQFVEDLCSPEYIDMKRFGPTNVVHFGVNEHIAGYSMTQLIETSLLSAHFANESRRAFINVFSCKIFDPLAVIGLAKRAFGFRPEAGYNNLHEGSRCTSFVNLRK